MCCCTGGSCLRSELRSKARQACSRLGRLLKQHPKVAASGRAAGRGVLPSCLPLKVAPHGGHPAVGIVGGGRVSGESASFKRPGSIFQAPSVAPHLPVSSAASFKLVLSTAHGCAARSAVSVSRSTKAALMKIAVSGLSAAGRGSGAGDGSCCPGSAPPPARLSPAGSAMAAPAEAAAAEPGAWAAVLPGSCCCHGGCASPLLLAGEAYSVVAVWPSAPEESAGKGSGVMAAWALPASSSARHAATSVSRAVIVSNARCSSWDRPWAAWTSRCAASSLEAA